MCGGQTELSVETSGTKAGDFLSVEAGPQFSLDGHQKYLSSRLYVSIINPPPPLVLPGPLTSAQRSLLSLGGPMPVTPFHTEEMQSQHSSSLLESYRTAEGIQSTQLNILS